MPIECEIELIRGDEREFRELDSCLTGLSFAIHNEMGRLLDERIYQSELEARALAAGIPVKRELEIRAIHKDFCKSHYIDFLAGNSFVYELKTTESLSAAHQAQLIHYLLLLNLNHGKLVNFRPASVQTRFVSSRLTLDDRKTVKVRESNWNRCDSETQLLQSCFEDLLQDWGACLDLGLYRSALLHFLQGPSAGLQLVEIISQGRPVGTQKVCLLSPDTAWHLSALRSNISLHQAHLERLLNHTLLKRIHWINLNHLQVTFNTLEKSK